MMMTKEASTNLHYKKKTNTVVESLIVLGAKWSGVGGPCSYLSITDMPSMQGETALKFARLIRDAVVLERAGALHPNTDRMGRVVGWHLNKSTQGGRR